MSVKASTFNKKARRHAADMHTRKNRAHSFRCHYCGAQLTQEAVTREHIRPLSKGGDDSSTNIVFACRCCNLQRGNSDYDLFKEYMLPVKRARAAGLPIPALPPYVSPARGGK
ncbi:hypothetical protein ABB22_17275 [Stenotrophomonas nitritireducens]|uniref:HNH nuclease domain-containing protein n=2 Tax=Stenotrophomonas nitritireducens TaxID=83617 RepID=A0ABR5NFJ2_9GAMM|nr:hypothetical protein ABB22_17275 [Stenotrophomonas nitritireducens]